MKEWGIPEDTYTYIFSKNLYPLIVRLIKELKVDPVVAGTLIGHKLKFVEGHYESSDAFDYNILFALCKYLQTNNIEFDLAERMLPHLYEHPKMDFDSVLDIIRFKIIPSETILSNIPFLKKKWAETKRKDSSTNEINWIMGQMRNEAIGNISLTELKNNIINSKS